MHKEYYQALENFIAELKVARNDALSRKAGRIKTWTRRLGSEARAREKFKNSPPLCTGMKVITVIRKYWLYCQEINRRHLSDPVDPILFMTDFLRSRSGELADFLSEIPYWPIAKHEYGAMGKSSTTVNYPTPDNHDELFQAYVNALRTAFDEAREEYGATLENDARVAKSEKAESVLNAKQSLLCTHPYVIEVFRHYFLACDALNRTAAKNEFVYPGIFSTEYLSGENNDLFDLMADLSYLPIGLDEKDRYV